jgi:hypothetical protein
MRTLLIFVGFGVILGIIIALNQKTCPFCKSRIDSSATTCPKCGKDLPPKAVKSSSDFSGGIKLLIGSIAVVAAIFLLKPTDTTNKELSAQDVERNAAVQQMNDNMSNIIAKELPKVEVFESGSFRGDSKSASFTVVATNKWLSLPHSLKLQCVQFLNNSFLSSISTIDAKYRPKAYGIYITLNGAGKVAQYESFSDKTEIFH